MLCGGEGVLILKFSLIIIDCRNEEIYHTKRHLTIQTPSWDAREGAMVTASFPDKI